MAEFSSAFEKMIANEGGYKLHTVKGDRGGMTYAGIARAYHDDWAGWALIDAGDMENEALASHVSAFYKKQFWDRIKGDDINDQQVATSIFDFAVNTGVSKAAKLAQGVVGASTDGKIGPNSVAKINAFDTELFLARFALTKVQRYADIVNADRSQGKFLLGWINRTLKGLS